MARSLAGELAALLRRSARRLVTHLAVALAPSAARGSHCPPKPVRSLASSLRSSVARPGSHQRGDLAGGDQRGVPYGRERRRVAEVERLELRGGHFVPDRGGDHVYSLRRTLTADDLRADQPAAPAFRDHLHRDG